MKRLGERICELMKALTEHFRVQRAEPSLAMAAGDASHQLTTLCKALDRAPPLVAGNTRVNLQSWLREVVEGYVEQSLMNCTCLAPEIGYEESAGIAKEAHRRGASIREVALERSGLHPERLDQLLDARSMTEPNPGPAGESAKGSRKKTKSGKKAKKKATKKKTNRSGKGARR